MKFLFLLILPFLSLSCSCPCTLIKEKREQRAIEKLLFKLPLKEKKFALQLNQKNQDLFIHRFDAEQRAKALNLTNEGTFRKKITPNEVVELLMNTQN